MYMPSPETPIIPDAKILINDTPAPGWKGGFSTSDPKFAYPDPDLSCIELTDNMANINKLTRYVDVLWPEFSWETVPGDPNSRCYQMFAPDISRGGYDDRGQFWSIICPQQGIYSPSFGSLNIEVTVTGQRGWIDETVEIRDYNLLAADITVKGQVWFAPSARDTFAYNLLKLLCELKGLPFPLDKANAIQVNLFKVGGDPKTKILPVRSGLNGDYSNPNFALHLDEAWGVANVAVEIGSVVTCGNPVIDDFNAMIMDIFNLGGGNVLKEGNVLTWNVWFDAPTLVDREAWAEHAAFWRHSIDTGHGSPDGQPSTPRYFDGTPFKPIDAVIEAELDKINAWLKKHVGISLTDSPPPDWGGPAPMPNPVSPKPTA